MITDILNNHIQILTQKHQINMHQSIHHKKITKLISSTFESNVKQPLSNNNEAPYLENMIIESEKLNNMKNKNNLQNEIESIITYQPRSLDLMKSGENLKEKANFPNCFFKEIKSNTEKENIYQPAQEHNQISLSTISSKNKNEQKNQKEDELKKMRGKDPVRVGLKTLEVENLIDMVDEMYEKAIDKKIKVQVGIAFEEKRQKFCSEREKMRVKWTENNGLVKELTSTGKGVSYLNQDPKKISSMMNFYSDLASFQIPIIDEDRESERFLSKTQRVCLETLPEDHDYENQSKEEENGFESKISQTFSDIKATQSPISSNISSSWIKSGLEFFHSQEKEKQIGSNCKCNEDQHKHEKEKARETFLTNKYNEILNKKESQRYKNEGLHERLEFNKQMREKESSTSKSFLQEKKLNIEDKAILKQPKQKEILHLNQQVKDQRNPSTNNSLKEILKAQNTKKSSEKEQRGVYESVLSNYSTAMLISFYKEKGQEKNKLSNSKEKLRTTKSLSLKKNKISDYDNLMPVLSSVGKEKIKKLKF